MSNNVNNKRRHCGQLMPNIYFALQAGAVYLIWYISMQIIDFFNYTTGVTYIISIFAAISVIFFVIKRAEVLDRQDEHCKDKEEEDNKKGGINPVRR